MIQLQIGTTILHGIWNSLQVEKKPTKAFFNRLFKGKSDVTFSIFLKMLKKIIVFGIRRFVYFMLLGIHINIVKKCYQLALNEQISPKSSILNYVYCMQIVIKHTPYFAKVLRITIKTN